MLRSSIALLSIAGTALERSAAAGAAGSGGSESCGGGGGGGGGRTRSFAESMPSSAPSAHSAMRVMAHSMASKIYSPFNLYTDRHSSLFVVRFRLHISLL